jgi:UDP-glucose 4-epimerase
MKALITGGAGFIGSTVADEFIRQGWDVVIVDNLSVGKRENVNPKATFYQVDIRDESLAEVFEKERPDLVDHHAAQVSVLRSVDDPLRDASINVLGSLNVIECSRKYGVKKVIYASSGGAEYGEPAYLPCDEKHPITPMSPYGATKHAPEHYLTMYRQLYGLDFTVLRYANVYGPRQDPLGEAGVIAIFVDRMLRGQPCTIFGNGEQERDFVFVGDLVTANLKAATAGGGIMCNIGTGVGTTVNQVFAELAHAVGYTLPAVHVDAKPGEIFRSYLEASLAAKELGWKAEVSLREGMTRTVEYFRRSGKYGG